MAPFSLKLSTVLTVISVALLVILSDNLFLDAWCDDVAIDAQSDVIEAGRREEGGRAKTYINFTMLLCPETGRERELAKTCEGRKCSTD